jgi:NADPH:quinone reductase
MKAWIIKKPGKVEDFIKVNDFEIPEPKENQIRIKVYSVSLNPVDWKSIKNKIKK